MAIAGEDYDLLKQFISCDARSFKHGLATHSGSRIAETTYISPFSEL